jgi:hypothetical protein
MVDDAFYPQLPGRTLAVCIFVMWTQFRLVIAPEDRNSFHNLYHEHDDRGVRGPHQNWIQDLKVFRANVIVRLERSGSTPLAIANSMAVGYRFLNCGFCFSDRLSLAYR